jgi:hypothetical protein
MTLRAGWLLSILVMVPALAAGQSLGEVAKKEQERRDRLRQKGVHSRPLTEEDLATTKGTVANEPTTANTASADGEKANGDDAEAVSGGGLLEVANDAPAQSGEGYWRGRVARGRARIAAAQRRLEALQLMIRVGQPAAFDENGKRVMYSVHQLKAKADQAAADLAAARQAVEDVIEEGRRAGVPPGWFR